MYLRIMAKPSTLIRQITVRPFCNCVTKDKDNKGFIDRPNDAYHTDDEVQPAARIIFHQRLSSHRYRGFMNKDLIDPSLSLRPQSYSFACGGWLQFYLFGVAKYLKEQRLHDGAVICGCSAGALTAAGLACEGDFDAAVEFCKDDCIPRTYNRLFGIFRLHEYVNDCLDHACRLYNYEHLKPGQLRLAVTTLPLFETNTTTTYSSAEDLKQCLLASSAAFPFAPLVYLRGKWSVDGGFTDFQPIVDENTITISPFYFSNTDIKPSRYVPLWWALFPPNNRNTVDWLYRLGYEDAKSYFHSRSYPPQKEDSSPAVTFQHPFDTPKRISMHRFLGFDVANATHASIAAIMDFSLYILLLFVWKPFSITLIYAELLLVMISHTLFTLLHELYDITPLLCIFYAFFSPEYPLMLGLSSLLIVPKLVIFGPSAGSSLTRLRECLVCLGCISFFLRILPAPPSINPPPSHDNLSKVSFVYRLVRHFI